VDINKASPHELTQLPGIAKDMAYKIVNHRNRHGLFTAWEELREVKGFPVDRLDEIKSRATLTCDDDPSTCAPPRHMEAHLAENAKRPEGYTRAMRSTRRAQISKERAGPRH
jgi:competence ComEA-like helix-hairpin-helix protein